MDSRSLSLTVNLGVETVPEGVPEVWPATVVYPVGELSPYRPGLSIWPFGFRGIQDERLVVSIADQRSLGTIYKLSLECACHGAAVRLDEQKGRTGEQFVHAAEPDSGLA